MEFEWDAKKAVANKLKHGISFELAITAFDDPYALVAPDPKHSGSEPRQWLLGESDAGVLVIVFTKRQHGNICRLISARRGNRKERIWYEAYKKLPL